jgi:hypothetical protein
MTATPPFSSALTVFGHGIYLTAAALVLFLAPGVLRIAMPFPAEFDWWNRVLALPVFNLGVLCIGAAQVKSRPLIKLATATRVLVMVSLAILVFLRAAPAIAIGIGIIDLISAGLTGWALAAEADNSR